MTWSCPAIDHGITIFPFGKIGPCCQVTPDALKPLSEINNPNRFAELKTQTPPPACQHCIAQEYQGLFSYRQFFIAKQTSAPGLQFVDLRTTSVCNLKCRSCGPHFSSAWAEELSIPITPTVDIDPYTNVLVSDSLQWMYFTGGEPLINADHWKLLQLLIKQGRASNISLMYNTNLSTIKFKDLDIQSLWSEFKNVDVLCSIDAIGQPLEHIRSGAKWSRIDANIQKLKQMSNVNIKLSPVISILSIWWIDQLCAYAQHNNLKIEPIALKGPDYLALDVIPDSLKEKAKEKLREIEHCIDKNFIDQLNSMIDNNHNNVLFNHTLSHILLLDKLRNETLFELLPFGDIAKQMILINNEYA